MDKANATTKGTHGSTAAASGSMADSVEQQVVAFAEQLGRIVGTVQAKADGWLDRDALKEQVSRVRDSASALLGQLGVETTKSSQNRGETGRAGHKNTASTGGRGRSGGAVDAPGKKHRKPTPNTPIRANAADASRVAKLKAANANRLRGRGRGRT